MLVCVEGPTGGGKSTLVKSFPSSYRRCPEVSHFIGRFPVCGPNSNDIEENVLTYLRGEEQASRMIVGYGGDWVQDRNWISQLTFLLALAKTADIQIEGHLDRVAAAIEERNIVVPNTLIYLRCPPILTAKRRKLRGTSEWGDVPPWLDEKRKVLFREHRASAYNYVFLQLPLNVVRLEAHQESSFQMLVEHEIHYSKVEPDYSSVSGSITELIDYATQ